MLPLTVIIPWRAQATRLAAFDAVVDWYRSNIPGVDIMTIDSDETVFNLSRCRNLGIDAISDDWRERNRSADSAHSLSMNLWV